MYIQVTFRTSLYLLLLYVLHYTSPFYLMPFLANIAPPSSPSSSTHSLSRTLQLFSKFSALRIPLRPPRYRRRTTASAVAFFSLSPYTGLACSILVLYNPPSPGFVTGKQSSPALSPLYLCFTRAGLLDGKPCYCALDRLAGLTPLLVSLLSLSLT